jgi:hypothetical protein
MGIGLYLYVLNTYSEEANTAAIARLEQATIQHSRLSSSVVASSENSEKTHEEKQILIVDLVQALSPSSIDAFTAIKAAQHFCQKQPDNDSCLHAIGQQLPSPQKTRWYDILTRLPRLNTRLANLPQNIQTPLSERLAVISQVRQDILGKDNAKLLFGKEEALISYQAALHQFIKSNPIDMPLVQRLQHVSSLKKQFLNEYQAIITPQGNYQNYLEALALAKIDAKDDEDLKNIQLQVRTMYLGAEKAKAMAIQDEWQQSQQQRMQQYQTEKKQILAQYTSPQHSSQQIAALDALRKKWFTTN